MKLFSKKLWMVLSVVFASLLMISISVMGVAYEREAVLNQFFRLDKFVQVEDGGEDEKVVTPEADYKTTEEIRAYFEQAIISKARVSCSSPTTAPCRSRARISR